MLIKKFFLGTLLIFGVHYNLFATDKAKDKAVFISGRISTNTDSVRLFIGFWDHFITGQGKEYSTRYVQVDKSGKFELKLPPIKHPYRLHIEDALSNNILFDRNQIAEPGDSVYIIGKIRDQQQFSEENFTAKFEGKGAAKYNCYQALKLVDDVVLRMVQQTTADRVRKADSLINVKERILSGYKKDISDEVYQIMSADLIGNIKYTVLATEAGGNGASKENNELLNAFLARRPSIPDQILAQSVGYIQFLYLKAKQEVITANHGKPYGMKQLYHKLKTEYSGRLREQLVAGYLLNELEVGVARQEDIDAYTYCLRDAVSMTETQWLKSPLEKLLKTKGKGAPAFNFTLPVDTTAKFLSLSDLKGKVVLIDMWSYICTGCYRFAGAFHEKVYPKFKEKDFKVVSIMLDRFAGKTQYKGRLRGEKGPAYTFPEYINLYGGKDEHVGRQIEEHYNIGAFPAILLIDKQGRIFSATVPFFDGPDSENVDKLIELIEKALAQS